MKVKNKTQYLNKLIFRLNVCFIILLLVTIYEFLYFVNHSYSGLSLVLLILSGAVTFFAYTLKQLFEDVKQ